MKILIKFYIGKNEIKAMQFNKYCQTIQGVKKVPDPKQNYIGLMTEG